MSAIVGVLETQVRASTSDFERGMDRASKSAKGFERNIGDAAQKAARGFGAAMTAVAASSAAAEKNWVSLGATLASSFAMGGPIVGGLTAAAAIIGTIVARSKEGEEAAKQLATAWEKSMEKVRAASEKTSERLAETSRENIRRGLGLDKTRFEMLTADALVGSLRKQLGEIVPLEAAWRERLGGMADPSGQLTAAERKELRELGDHADRVRAELTQAVTDREKLARLVTAEGIAQKQLATEAEREADARERSKAALDGMATGKLPGAGFTREEIARGLVGGSMFTPAPPGVGTGKLTGAWNMETFSGTVSSPPTQVFDPVAEDRARLELLAERIAAPFHDAFASAVVDGFRTGFDNLRDIGEGLVANWLGMLAHAASQRLFGGLFESIAGAAGGSVLQVLPVAVPGDVVNAGIQANGGLQSTIHVIGSDVRTLEEYRRG